MCNFEVISGGFKAFSEYQEGIAQSKYYKYQEDQSRQEGKLAIERGDLQSKLIQDQASQEGKRLATNQAEFNATQKAVMGASGVSGVTSEDIINSTFSKQKLDELALRYNADTRSYEVKEGAKYENYAAQTRGDQFRYASKYAKIAGRRQAFSTILNTIASVQKNASQSSGGGKSGGKK